MAKKAWVGNFLRRLMAIQHNVLYDFPEEKKQAGYGRSARLIIEGDGGGVFDLWFCEQGVRPKPENVEVKNTVHMTEETLLNLVTPDIKLDELVQLVESEGGIEKAGMMLRPRLEFTTALANNLVTIGGDKPDVDSEEWSVILDRVLLKIAFPIVIRGLLRQARERKGGS